MRLTTLCLLLTPITGLAQQAVSLPSSFQQALGCSGNWQPECSTTQLEAVEGAWKTRLNLPTGAHEYKAALNNTWEENYGLHARRDGDNIPLNLPSALDVNFYYSHQSHWITDNQNSEIAVAPGDFQIHLGCEKNWDPACFHSWLQDTDGDGMYQFRAQLPAGHYQVKVAHNEGWEENYGENGEPNGNNIHFEAKSQQTLLFTYDPISHRLNIQDALGTVGDLSKAKAYWIDKDTLAWDTNAAVVSLYHSPEASLRMTPEGITGGHAYSLEAIAGGMTPEQKARFPHLSHLPTFRFTANNAIKKQLLKGQLALAAYSVADQLLDATAIQIPGVLDDLFNYTGKLGPDVQHHSATLRLWAPTAQSVDLLLYPEPDADTFQTLPMHYDTGSGTWSISGNKNWSGKYYLYQVKVFTPSTQRIEVNRVTDPYSLSLSTNSRFSQLIDIEASSLKPRGWQHLVKPRFTTPEDMVIYELHPRDFSIQDQTLPEKDRGKFSAFAHKRSAGMRYLRKLAKAGVSHLHLLPSFDIATINEIQAQQQEVDRERLNRYPADSQQQQAAVAAIKEQDGFNWGYDPLHFTVPEGSYSTQPEGTRRILEFRQMVKHLNLAGLRVVMDVVYNHTHSSGQAELSILDRIVPGYYHRLNGIGEVETSSCCANTATEHKMMEKLMIDSVLTWAKAYKVDGFRFDLMGHHSKQNMLNLRAALDALTLKKDGVKGKHIYLYGEGWNFGEVANDARFVQATQANMAGTGIGTFSDRLRDGARGGNPFGDVREQGFVNGLGTAQSDYQNGKGDGLKELKHLSDWIRIGLAGDIADYPLINATGDRVTASEVDYFGQNAGYTQDPQENIAYVSAHDNETLFDANQLKLPHLTNMAHRVRVQNLSNALVLLGQGVPFIHAGQDFLRSKSMDRDSYNSGDWFNAIDWSQATSNWGKGLPIAEKNQDNWPIMAPLLADPALAPDTVHRLSVQGAFMALLKIRKHYPLLRLTQADEIKRMLRFHNTGPEQIPGVIAMSLDDEHAEIDAFNPHLLILFNAQSTPVVLSLSHKKGKKYRLVNEIRNIFDSSEYRTYVENGDFLIPARGFLVYRSH